MLAKAQTITEHLEKWAPLSWGEEWDYNGYMTGHPESEVSAVVVALDLTLDLVEAAPAGSLIVCHHPPVLPGRLTSLRRDQPEGALLSRAIEQGLTVYVAHTNLDVAPGGTADALATALGLEEVTPGPGARKAAHYKLVVFVPAGYQDPVRAALAQAGAGWIGNYSHCTYQTLGEGTFMAQAGANPFLGQVGELEKAEEYRLETIVPQHLLDAVLRAMRQAHPYEEVAFDVYPLLYPGAPRSGVRLGCWKPAGELAELGRQVARNLQVAAVRVAGELSQTVTRVAVAPGAGGSAVTPAATGGAEVLITGELGYHQVQAAVAAGLAVIVAGHQATELPLLPAVARHLEPLVPPGELRIWTGEPLLRVVPGEAVP